MSMFLFIIFSYKRLERMMKRNMRVTWTRVGGPHPQTTGWFDPQVDSARLASTARFSRYIGDEPHRIASAPRRKEIGEVFNGGCAEPPFGW